MIRIGGCTISVNGIGLDQPAGQILTFSDNYITANGVNGTPTASISKTWSMPLLWSLSGGFFAVREGLFMSLAQVIESRRVRMFYRRTLRPANHNPDYTTEVY